MLDLLGSADWGAVSNSKKGQENAVSINETDFMNL